MTPWRQVLLTTCSEYYTGLLKNAFYKRETARVRSFPPAPQTADIILPPPRNVFFIVYYYRCIIIFSFSAKTHQTRVRPFSEPGTVNA